MSIKIKHVPYLPTEELNRLLMTSNNDALIEAVEEELEKREIDFQENPFRYEQDDTPSLELPSYLS